MQKINENQSGFSSPCVDNSPKNQQKSDKNQVSNDVLGKNSEKKPNFTEKSDTSPDKTTIFEGNNGDLNAKQGIDSKNNENGTVSKSDKDKTSKTDDNANNSSTMNENSNKNSENYDQNNENSDSSRTFTTFEESIDRDYNDFKVIYPNVSKKSLLNDNSFRIFAEGKEDKSVAVNYAKYITLCNIIRDEAILQERNRQNTANSSSGALSSTQNANHVYFTREQVKNMSPSEIKRNYELIRKSQQNW